MNDIAQRIVDQCKHDPSDNVDPHPKLFSDLEDDRTSEALFKLWRKGIVDAEWDDQDEATRWRLSHFGVELNERGLVRAYVTATDGEVNLGAGPETLVDPREVR